MKEPLARWVPRDRRQVEIHRLMGTFGPAVAAFYADACRLVVGDPPLVSRTHLVGHLLRELESALREILRPMIPAERAASLFTKCGECGRVEGDQKREIDEIATALGFPPDDEVRLLWKSLGLHKVTHRGSQLGPRPVDDDFRALWDNAQILLLRLGRQFESSFAASLPLIDGLAGKEKPVHSDGKKLQSVPHSVVALERFFAQAGPGWFSLLRGKGYLGDPPPLEVADDQTIAYVRWPAGRYLARMAAEPSVQRDVLEVALALETDNPQAHECVAEAALALPTAAAARLAPRIASFLASRYQWALPPKVRDLIARLAHAGEADAALLLLRSLLEAEAGRGGWRSAGLVPELIAAVFPQLGLDGLALLADLLDQALDERIPGGRTWRDHSYGWRGTLDGGREHDREQALTSALRDAAVLLAHSDQPGVAPAVEALERRERAIFHRLALHVLRHVPDEALIAERIGRRDLYDDLHVEREYTLLLRERRAILPREIQARVIGWIDAGPQEIGLQPEAIDRWRLGQLTRFGDALPEDQVARYQKLVERFGEPAEPEMEGWVGPTAPLSTEELLALRDDEIVAQLRSWQPDTGWFAPSREGLRRNLEVLERVDRDDDPLVVGERVAGGRDLLADPLDALGVEPDQGDRETGPQLVLELLEDVPRGDHQDALAAAAPDQLGEDHADLERLAEADRVGDQQPRPERLEGRLDRVPLVLELIEELPVSHGQAGLGRRQRGLADQRLEVQAAAPEPGSRVEHQGGVLRPQRLDVVQLGEEGRLLVADQLGGADHPDELAVRRCLLDRPDKPLLVADHDLRPWGDERQDHRWCRHR